MVMNQAHWKAPYTLRRSYGRYNWLKDFRTKGKKADWKGGQEDIVNAPRSVPDEVCEKGQDEETREMKQFVLRENLMVRNLVCWQEP